MEILNRQPRPKSNHFFSEELKQSYNYEAESIIEKKNFLDLDNRLNKKHTLNLEEKDRATTTKIEFYEQQLRQLDQINQNYI